MEKEWEVEQVKKKRVLEERVAAMERREREGGDGQLHTLKKQAMSESFSMYMYVCMSSYIHFRRVYI